MVAFIVGGLIAVGTLYKIHQEILMNRERLEDLKED
jgi:hypothetical protein